MQNKYTIPLRELEVGMYQFEFDLDDEFFSSFEGGEVQHGDVTAVLDVERHNNLMLINFSFDGEVEVICDRCLEAFFIPVESEFGLSVRFSALMAEQGADIDVEDETEEDIMFVDPADDELDLATYMYESVCLSLPIQRVHPNDENGNTLCNPEMMKYIQQTVSSKEDDLDDELFDDEEIE